MYWYEDIVQVIQEKVDNGELDYEEACKINDISYQRYLDEFDAYTEGEKLMAVAKPIAKGTGVAAGTIDKPINTIGKGVLKGTGKVADVVAKVAIKKPDTNADVHVVDEYKEKMNKFKGYFKFGTIVAINVPLSFIPCTNMPFNAAVASVIGKSNDPSDKEVMKLVNKLKETMVKFGEKLKSFVNIKQGKIFSETDKAELEKLYADGFNIAKNAETKIKNALSKSSVGNKSSDKKVVNESSYDIQLIDLLFNENGKLNGEPFDIINTYIENVEYDLEEQTFNEVQKYINLF